MVVKDSKLECKSQDYNSNSKYGKENSVYVIHFIVLCVPLFKRIFIGYNIKKRIGDDDYVYTKRIKYNYTVDCKDLP